MSSLRHLILAVAAATLPAVTYAQAPAASAPGTVGVEPDTARETMREAVPRSDTATVIENNETPSGQAREAAENARDAAENARDAAAEAREQAADTAGSDTSTSTPASSGTAAGGESGQGMRAARADRN